MTELTSCNRKGIAHNATPAATATAVSTVPGGADMPALWFYNPTGATVRIELGLSDVQAAALSWPLPPGEFQPFAKGSATHFSAWVASGTVGIEVFAGAQR
jgi:hypothetical protein